MMHKWIGVLCILAGLAVMGSAGWLFWENQQESQLSQMESAQTLIQVQQQIAEKQEQKQVQQQEPVGDAEPPATVAPIPDIYDVTMTEVEINGYGYIGYLSMPELDMELPVMADLDDSRLKIAPCRMTGTVKGENLVIGAHNYDATFGKLWFVSIGMDVFFTDMDGEVWQYRVAEVEDLQSNEGSRMCEGVYPLTLFTCTYAGRSRLAVRCDWVDAS